MDWFKITIIALLVIYLIMKCVDTVAIQRFSNLLSGATRPF